MSCKNCKEPDVYTDNSVPCPSLTICEDYIYITLASNSDDNDIWNNILISNPMTVIYDDQTTEALVFLPHRTIVCGSQNTTKSYRSTIKTDKKLKYNSGCQLPNGIVVSSSPTGTNYNYIALDNTITVNIDVPDKQFFDLQVVINTTDATALGTIQGQISNNIIIGGQTFIKVSEVFDTSNSYGVIYYRTSSKSWGGDLAETIGISNNLNISGVPFNSATINSKFGYINKKFVITLSDIPNVSGATEKIEKLTLWIVVVGYQTASFPSSINISGLFSSDISRVVNFKVHGGLASMNISDYYLTADNDEFPQGIHIDSTGNLKSTLQTLYPALTDADFTFEEGFAGSSLIIRINKKGVMLC